MTSMRLWWEYRPLYKDNLFIVPSWPEQNTLQEIRIFRNQEAKHCPLYFCSKVTQLNFKRSFWIHCKGCLFFYVSYYDWVWCLMLINLKLVCWQGFLDVNPFGCNSVLLWTWVFSRLQLCWMAWSWLAHWRLTSMKNIWPFKASMVLFTPLFLNLYYMALYL